MIDKEMPILISSITYEQIKECHKFLTVRNENKYITVFLSVRILLINKIRKTVDIFITLIQYERLFGHNPKCYIRGSEQWISIRNTINCLEIGRVFSVPLSLSFSKRVEIGIPGPVIVMKGRSFIVWSQNLVIKYRLRYCW